MSIQNFSFRISLPKLICSLPVILVTLYFVPPIGIILTIARLFIYGSYRYYRVPAAIIVVALLCLVPRAYELLQQNFGVNIPFLQFLVDFRLHPLYQKLTDFGRWVAIFSLIMFVVSLILGKVATAVSGALRMARMASSERSTNTNKPGLTHDNPAKHQTDQTTPHVVKCPDCGKANHIIGTVGTCKSCRNAIEWTGPKTSKK